MTEPIRVVIADDHPIFREGLVRTIEGDGSYAIVGQAADGAAALQMIRQLHPDIAILDVTMPVMSGIDAVRTAHADALPTSMVLMTMHTEPEYFDAAMDLGVRGYLIKDSVTGDVLRCLSAVVRGEYYVSPSIAQFLIDRKKRSESLRRSQPALDRLTPAERTVLRMLATNLTSKEIADRLFVSVRTIESHRQHISEKLALKGPHKLLQFALEHRSEL